MGPGLSHGRKIQKTHKAKFSINQMVRDKIEKKSIKKDPK
jgi:hypothetical protein